MTDEQLKPCPFCGGAAKVIYNSGNEVWNQKWSAGCEPCGAFFTRSGSNTWAGNAKEDREAKMRAIALWNRRAPLAEVKP